MRPPFRTFTLAVAMGLAALAVASPGRGAARARPLPVERLSTVQARSLQDRLLAGRAGAEGGYPICRAHRLTCDADILTRDGSTAPLTAFTPFGLGPRNLEAAYRVRRQPGGGGTIAVIDAGAYPIIESDLNAYRTQFGIPKCRRSTGCLRVLNFDGGPQRAPARTSLGKANEEMLGLETALDVDAASAACPRCRLIVLQVPLRDALLSTTADTHRAERHFATGVRTARRLGADAVNISFGLPSDLYATSGAPARMMRLAGIAVTSSTGDFGYNGLAPPWPQVLPTVIAVGGTALTQASNGTWHESAWSGAGSGCAPGVRPANGQPVWVSNTCNGARASADISAVADPVTGVSVFDTYAPASDLPFKWVVMGGTSASSPLVAGLYARAGVPAGVDGPNQLYRQPAADFYDVLAGANAARGICSADGVSERVCTADVGWDGPTGRGTPRGFATFR